MLVENHGSVVMLTPEDAYEREWVAENVMVPEWGWMGASFACEPRLVEAILAGIDGCEAD